ncbi:probable choline kinase 2 isoform X1 [Panicum virgatum]|uniref:probable choline kinase 2 isoform X1 n=1 Tax=Panicum virgatum TaxID=38727 RepID=UPI0019D5C58F|nr:probable choline kinase 2 isoform X1 [Panicum virgatum]
MVGLVAIENQSQVARAVVAEAVLAAGPRIPKEARLLLHELAAAWADVADCRALQVVPLKGAMTNEVYQVRWLTGVPSAGGEAEEPRGEREVRKVLVRIYGDGVDLFFDREDEVRTFECMSRHGQGPRLLGRFPNGRVEEFIHARTLSATDLRDPDISALVASKLREFHNLDMPGPKSVLIWDRLRNWLKTAMNLCSSDEAKEFGLDSLENEITALQNDVSGDYHWIGFCHNDLQYGNIMIDEETNMLTIIDYEYASFNPVAYDIANHFCEMAADYHSANPHILDYSKYPGIASLGELLMHGLLFFKSVWSILVQFQSSSCAILFYITDIDEQKRFLKTYLSISGEEPDAEEVENLLQSIEKYTLASHLVWGLWGIISDHVNDIDFDYKEYARQRFEQYWQKKSANLQS